MTVDLYSTRVSAPLGIQKDAQPPRNGAFAKMAARPILAGGLGAESPSTSTIVATRSLLARLIGTCR
jgi:hypothetical protein